jgi:hypothetical protein
MSSWAARSTIDLRFCVDTLCAISAQYVLFMERDWYQENSTRMGTELSFFEQGMGSEHWTLKITANKQLGEFHNTYLLCIISSSSSETLCTTNFLNLLGR